MSITDEMRKIIAEQDASGEPLMADDLVERARDRASFPGLNEHFWGVSERELAQEARINRAHRLIIQMRITVVDTGQVTRLMVHTPGTPGYMPHATVSQSLDLVQLKLSQLATDIGRARQRLSAFRAALPASIADDLDQALAAAEELTRHRRESEEAAA